MLKDGPKEIATGARWCDRRGAERVLLSYLAAKHGFTLQPKADGAPTALGIMSVPDNVWRFDELTSRWKPGDFS